MNLPVGTDPAQDVPLCAKHFDHIARAFAGKLTPDELRQEITLLEQDESDR